MPMSHAFYIVLRSTLSLCLISHALYAILPTKAPCFFIENVRCVVVINLKCCRDVHCKKPVDDLLFLVILVLASQNDSQVGPFLHSTRVHITTRRSYWHN